MNYTLYARKMKIRRQKKKKIMEILAQAVILIMFVISMTLLIFALSMYQ